MKQKIEGNPQLGVGARPDPLADHDLTTELQLAVDVQAVSHRYGSHEALRDLNLQVSGGEIFALLGPNGSGKTTLFRLTSTLARLQSGEIRVFGNSVRSEQASVRASLGVVFQSPSLDPKLTVLENIRCQAVLYGMSGSLLLERIDAVTKQLGLQDRLATRTEELSGGLKRRVELAKSILHRPRLLLMDEPSTGLDPAARLDVWHALTELVKSSGVTVLLTTHLLEEADKADRIAILHQGQVVALGRPADLRRELGEQVLSITTSRQSALLDWLTERDVVGQLVENQIRVVGARAAEIIQPINDAFGEDIHSMTLGRPGLEDVFIAKTGHRFWNEVQPVAKPGKRGAKRAASRHVS